MGFILKLFGTLVTALAFLSTAHHFGWLPLGDVLTIVAEGYTSFVTDFLFYPAQTLARDWTWFEVLPNEALIITLLAMLLLGPATLGLIPTDHDVADSGPSGLVILRLFYFAIVLTAFGFVAGALPAIATLLIFGMTIIGGILYYVVRAYFLQWGDDPESEYFQGRMRFVAFNLLLMLGTVILLFALDRFTKLEDGCVKILDRCLIETGIVDEPEEEIEDPEPSDTETPASGEEEAPTTEPESDNPADETDPPAGPKPVDPDPQDEEDPNTLPPGETEQMEDTLEGPLQ
jgi:hypothetical protein